VRRSLQRIGIEYPIAIDNDYAIWRAFDNHYWPALYFIDGRGRVRDSHFGEGEYERSERTIQKLLAETDSAASARSLVSGEARGVEAPADWGTLKSPETYVGYDRIERFASPGGAKVDKRRAYAAPDRLRLNEWALAGEWLINRQATILNSPNGRIAYRFHARDLHLVMGPPRRENPVRVRVSLDGRPPGPSHGLDVDEEGYGTVIDQRLYQLIRQRPPIVERQFEIEFLDPGAETFAFTFG